MKVLLGCDDWYGITQGHTSGILEFSSEVKFSKRPPEPQGSISIAIYVLMLSDYPKKQIGCCVSSVHLRHTRSSIAITDSGAITVYSYCICQSYLPDGIHHAIINAVVKGPQWPPSGPQVFAVNLT